MGQDENKQRGNWSSNKDYILSLAGYAVGLGNLWRFPYLCYKNGGGAFLIPYLVMVVLVGVPLFLLESAVGQFSSSGFITLFSVSPMFRGVAYTKVLVNLIASSYYGMVVAYPVVFLVYSLGSSVPWESCDHPWNTPHCFTPGEGEGTRLSLLDSLNASSAQHDKLVFPADDFFHNKVLQISGGIGEPDGMVWYLVGASALVWCSALLCIIKGVKVLGKVVWFTATFPLVMLVILFARGVTLPGAWIGISYYIVPDFNRLLEPGVWVDAAVQVFYSFGAGWGTIPTMSSFSRFNNNCIRNSIIVPIINASTSIFAGFVVFSVLGFLSRELGTSVAEVTTAGPALAFVTYPQALAFMPMPSLWSLLFFLMLFFLGIDSAFVQMESLVVALVDAFPKLRSRRGLVALSVCLVIFLGSFFCCTRGGFYVLQLLDKYSVAPSLLPAAICEVLVLCYVYGGGRLIRDFEMMLGRELSVFWYICWVVLTPMILGAMFISTMGMGIDISYRGYVFPYWTHVLGWAIAVVCVLAIPVYIIYYLLSAKGTLSQRLWTGFTPSPSWGPALEHHRQEWMEYCALHPLPNRFFHRDCDCRSRKSRKEEVLSPEELTAMTVKIV
ncbi:sodium- and chloride-dependent glycine transporter 2-like [Eriocheir sinensis]|uniref:sodium- and chloride-dependent glycine transporter 2-like n=1 Tax=Eriocheir sinensis TaxID=95602 RepID=UPI0021C5CA6C|nr:sodium- and chloride-dependent glycine transporter 2-like [Eriocheir sinensis]XP_050721779.1 sodium- and chloride-dependent glycine transporter 2-like [Eriocheir sinensis]XP_050721780.1 sodium- and chloride-dependent glycine transporter 2-like [Eriocheir sinensis]XP_050721781.1 sodium- and chloride-dependent glycine transporter 2-like [Eriocheir sinensis]XP_050721782.1 sodium- and chloride-dependent glycine transporter 2-like [Eriocheir sinensis]XP_050721783.1 sodium- and chloride-dependent